MTRDECVEELRESVDQEGTITAWSRKHGFHPSYVSNVMQGVRPPSERLLAALGITVLTIYQKS